MEARRIHHVTGEQLANGKYRFTAVYHGGGREVIRATATRDYMYAHQLCTDHELDLVKQLHQVFSFSTKLACSSHTAKLVRASFRIIYPQASWEVQP
jgi:hypothetical protein